MRNNLESLTDSELICSLRSLVGGERRTVVAILRHLAELDRRRFAVGAGYPSLFDYCVRELGYAQGEAARRIHAARAASKYPILYRAIERGLLSLTTVSLLAPHLKWDNYRSLIQAAIGLSTREVDALVSSLVPPAAAPAERVRIIAVAPVDTAARPPDSAGDDLFALPIEAPPSAAASGHLANLAQETEFLLAPSDPPALAVAAPIATPAPIAAPAQPDYTVRPVAAVLPAVRRVHFSFTADEALLRDVERAKELSRHKWPAGRLEDVLAGAIQALLEKIDPDKRIESRTHRKKLSTAARSRKIPRSLRREVWRRDGGRCVFTSSNGRICGARSNLEFDHVRPWARGGGSLDPANVRLLCRAHNSFEARWVFGEAVIDAAVARRSAAASALRKPAKYKKMLGN